MKETPVKAESHSPVAGDGQEQKETLRRGAFSPRMRLSVHCHEVNLGRGGEISRKWWDGWVLVPGDTGARSYRLKTFKFWFQTLVPLVSGQQSQGVKYL